LKFGVLEDLAQKCAAAAVVFQVMQEPMPNVPYKSAQENLLPAFLDLAVATQMIYASAAAHSLLNYAGKARTMPTAVSAHKVVLAVAAIAQLRLLCFAVLAATDFVLQAHTTPTVD
jgi:hypothetical protein